MRKSELRGRVRAGVAVAVAVGCAAGVTACGGDADGETGPVKNAKGEYVVRVTDDGYHPRRLRIRAGDRISFVNRTKTGLPHSAQDERRGDIDPSPGEGPTDHSGKDVNYAYKRGFATHSLFPGEAQTIVFRVPQRYEYYCTFHGDRMRGVVEVLPRKERG